MQFMFSKFQICPYLLQLFYKKSRICLFHFGIFDCATRYFSCGCILISLSCCCWHFAAVFAMTDCLLTRPTLSQFWSLKIRRSANSNSVSFRNVDRRIFKLLNYERVGRVDVVYAICIRMSRRFFVRVLFSFSFPAPVIIRVLLSI